MVEHDLADFILCSLPDNDTYSHRRGPFAQVTSIAVADRALERIMHVAGGPARFLEDHAVIVMSDHSQTAVEHSLDVMHLLGEEWRVLGAADPAPEEAELAVSPTGRYGMVYVLDEAERERVAPALMDRLAGTEGVDLVARRIGDEATVRSARGELRFAPGGELRDRRGNTWSVDGELATLDLRTRDGVVASDQYPWRSTGCGRRSPVRAWGTSWCQRRPGGSSWTGAGRHTSGEAATERFTAATHWGR